MFHPSKFLTNCFRHSPIIVPFSTLFFVHAAYNVTTAELQLHKKNYISSKISANLFLIGQSQFLIFCSLFVTFTHIFAPATYKVTTTTSKFTFYNCTFHFTTAEIVISYTLNYAMPSRMRRLGRSYNFYRRSQRKVSEYRKRDT